MRADGFLYEILQRVLPDGTILGCGHDHDTSLSMKGVTITRTGTTVVDPTWSMNNGGTPDGRHIVGFYNDGHNIGYTIDDGVLTPFMVPGALHTVAWDINARGDVVGVVVKRRLTHGFISTEAGYTLLDYPGATATRAFGVNSRGDVVGYRTSSPGSRTASWPRASISRRSRTSGEVRATPIPERGRLPPKPAGGSRTPHDASGRPAQPGPRSRGWTHVFMSCQRTSLAHSEHPGWCR